MSRAAATGIERMKACLRRLGFTAQRGGPYRLNGTLFRMDGAWPVLERALPRADGADALRGRLGKAGLWKHVTNGRDLTCRFELPPGVLAAAAEDGDGDGEAACPLEAALTWAIATAGGEAPADWRPPAPDEMDLPGSEFIVQHGRFVRHGRVVRDGHRLALRVPILPHLSEALDPSRWSWLRALLTDAQDRFCLVRIGTDSPDAAVMAEVDLSGAPHGLLETLIRTGRDGLCWVVIWLVASAELLADPKVASEALQVGPVGGSPP